MSRKGLGWQGIPTGERGGHSRVPTILSPPLTRMHMSLFLKTYLFMTEVKPPLHFRDTSVTVLHTVFQHQPCVYLCISQAQTLEQAHEMAYLADLGFCEAPRVVAAKIDRDRQEPWKLFVTFLMDSTLVVLLENNLTSPATVDMSNFVGEIFIF